MLDIDELLELSKRIAIQAGEHLNDGNHTSYSQFKFSEEDPKEIKALADVALEKIILSELEHTGISILSEESGFKSGKVEQDHMFILDPLDGTFNFVKDLGPSAVSIALWKNNKPIFGVIYNLTEKKLYWGGAGIGSFCENSPIKVSLEKDKSHSSLCTGFPARFDLSNKNAPQDFWDRIKSFAKIRMLGSAAASLLYVAKGSAEMYFEPEIMLWDVAAGIAIVEGAGGTVNYTSGKRTHALDVSASNGCISN